MGAKLTIKEIRGRIPANSKLSVVKFSGYYIYPNARRHRKCLFKCQCGNTLDVAYYRVISGNTRSCGCAASEFHFRKYTVTIKKLRTCYTDMIRRCYDSKCANYKSYGAKGVRVCKKWRNSYQEFLNWAISAGWQNGLHLDKDKNGNGMLYSPRNCCWLTFKENMKYTRRSKFYMYKGKKYNAEELSIMSGICKATIYSRVTIQKLSVEDALSKPIKNKK